MLSTAREEARRGVSVAVYERESALVPALHRYEVAMLAHGFDAVRASVLYTRLAISRVGLLCEVAKRFFHR
jgi:hypothetical protein